MSQIFLTSLPVNYYATRVQSGECFSWLIENPTNKDYKFLLSAPFAGVINSTLSICTSGSATGTFKINNPILGLIPLDPNAITQSKQKVSQIIFFNTGDDLLLNLSNVANCSDVTFSVQYIKAYN